jgi:hypothetical protein
MNTQNLGFRLRKARRRDLVTCETDIHVYPAMILQRHIAGHLLAQPWVGAMVGATGLLLVSRDPQTVPVGQEVVTDLAGALGVLLEG